MNSQTRTDSWGSPPLATTVWACQSWFCRKRGPFWVTDRNAAEVGARRHRALKFLGLWSHQAVVCPHRGLNFADFLHKVRL
jgi:hypothetical protein